MICYDAQKSGPFKNMVQRIETEVSTWKAGKEP